MPIDLTAPEFARTRTQLSGDVVEKIGLIEQFQRGRTDDAYFSDMLFRSAVERNLSIIAEAASRLACDTPTCPTDYDWKRLSALGELLRQSLRDINNEAMWREITTSLPLAKQAASAALKG